MYLPIMDDSSMYASCRCDTTRIQSTSIDGHNMHCDKCMICGVYGHHRPMPGSLRQFTAGWCSFHYTMLASVSNKKMKNTFARANHDPERVAHMLCRHDMGETHFKRKAEQFIRRKKHPNFDTDLHEYMHVGGRDSVSNFMRHIPNNFPFEWVSIIVDRLVWNLEPNKQ